MRPGDRVGYTVDIRWEDHRVKEARIVSDAEGEFTVRCNGKVTKMRGKAGEQITI